MSFPIFTIKKMKTKPPFLISVLFIFLFSLNTFGQKNPDRFIAMGLQADAQLLYQDNPRFPFSNSFGIFYQNYFLSNWSVSLSYSLAQRRYHNFSSLSPTGVSSGPTPFIFLRSIFIEKSHNLKAAVKYYLHRPEASYFATIGAVQKVGFKTQGETESSYRFGDTSNFSNSKKIKNIGFDFGIGVEYEIFNNILVGVQTGAHLFGNQERGDINTGGFFNEERKGGINNFYLQLQVGYTFDMPDVLKNLKKK